MTNKRNWMTTTVSACVIGSTLLAGPGLAAMSLLAAGQAATTLAADLGELRRRFQERYPALLEIKRAGKAGETYLGYVEVRTEVTKDQQTLIGQENADRRTLYEELARQEKTTPEVVAERNAKRNFERAASGEWLKHVDGWKQKP